MSDLKIEVGQVYRAKRPSNAHGYVNDRQVKWLSFDGSEVLYDGPAVTFGRHYPKVTLESFKKWAARNVTEELPDAEWQPWVP